MKTSKEINKMIANLLGEEPTYDIRKELKIIETAHSLEGAKEYINAFTDQEDRHLYSITSSSAENYSDDVNLALYAAKRIAERNEQTFVLSLENGTWKAAYGGYSDCAEYSGSNPAYVSCVAVLKYMGKL